MARIGASLTVKSTTLGSETFASVRQIADPVSASTSAAAQATVAADIATLVADGASPTQDHVNTLNTDYTTFVATLAPVPAGVDMLLSIDLAKVTSLNVLRLGFKQIEQALIACGAVK